MFAFEVEIVKGIIKVSKLKKGEDAVQLLQDHCFKSNAVIFCFNNEEEAINEYNKKLKNYK